MGSDGEASVVSETPSQASGRRRRRNRQRTRNRSNRAGGGLADIAVVGDAANNAVDAVGNTANQVTNATQNVANNAGGGDDKPLKLRLDLNFDVEIELKARVHGDVTLALLR